MISVFDIIKAIYYVVSIAIKILHALRKRGNTKRVKRKSSRPRHR